MKKNESAPSSANDNRLACVSDALEMPVISRRLRSVLDELSASGVADAALIEALFSHLSERAHRAGESDGGPDGRHALDLYNQLSRLSGELEGIKAVLLQQWAHRQSQP